jgi:hypothetical protein
MIFEQANFSNLTCDETNCVPVALQAVGIGIGDAQCVTVKGNGYTYPQILDAVKRATGVTPVFARIYSGVFFESFVSDILKINESVMLSLSYMNPNKKHAVVLKRKESGGYHLFNLTSNCETTICRSFSELYIQLWTSGVSLSNSTVLIGLNTTATKQQRHFTAPVGVGRPSLISQIVNGSVELAHYKPIPTSAGTRAAKKLKVGNGRRKT